MTEKNVVGVERREDQMPVFRADIMNTSEDRIQPVAGVGGVSPVSPVSIETSSVDAVELWRLMSERLRDRRLARENSQLRQETAARAPVPDNFQQNYEQDSLQLNSSGTKNMLSDLLMKIRLANLDVDPNLLVKPEEEDYHLSEDGILKVGNVMTTNVISVIDSTTIEQTASIFNRRKITGIPVVHYLTKNLLGVISTTDIISHIFEGKVISTFNTDGTFFRQDTLGILERPVRDFMNTDVITVSPYTSVKEACKLMSENNIHRVIVTENDKVKGIFSSSDVVKLLAKENFEISIKQEK